MLKEEEVPEAGISKLACVVLALGVVDEPIDVVSTPPLIVKAIELVEVAVAGAKRAATLNAPPSIVNVEPFPQVNELFDVPTL
jgi:hypothetical protein